MAFLLFRLALVAGAVYGTNELGVWDSADRTVVLFADAKRQISPYTEDMMHRFCCWRCDKCSDETEVKPWRESMVDAWNETVKKTFYAMGVQAPDYLDRFADDVGQGMDNLRK